MKQTTNNFPVSLSRMTPRMLSDEPIRIDGMKLVFDDKVAVYPAKLRVEDDGDGKSDYKRG